MPGALLARRIGRKLSPPHRRPPDHRQARQGMHPLFLALQRISFGCECFQSAPNWAMRCTFGAHFGMAMKPTKGCGTAMRSNALPGRKGGVTFPIGRGASDNLHEG